MKIIQRTEIEMFIKESETLEKLFYNQIKMQKDAAQKKFGIKINKLRDMLLSNVKIKCVIESYKIVEIKGGSILLANGTKIHNKKMSEAFSKSKELAICVVSVIGYDNFEYEDYGRLERLFIDCWGTAIIQYANNSILKDIKRELSKQGLYCTYGWSPGQHHIDIKLQKILFDLIKPDTIGVELNNVYMMHPKKTVSCFFGIGENAEMENERPCDNCNKRRTCPSAYNDLV